MPLNEDHAFAEHTTPQDWEDLATRHGLDGSRLDEGERVHRADHAGRRAGELSRSSIGFARFARFSFLGPYHLSFFREAS